MENLKKSAQNETKLRKMKYVFWLIMKDKYDVKNTE
jgi:hypothetical protein